MWNNVNKFWSPWQSPPVKCLIDNGLIFQQDNAPNHTALKVKSYLKQKEQSGEVEVMKWPRQSPELNIIESLWNYLDQRKAEKQPKLKEYLWQVLQDAWNNTPMDYIYKLQLSILKRINAVQAVKGRHSEY